MSGLLQQQLVLGQSLDRPQHVVELQLLVLTNWHGLKLRDTPSKVGVEVSIFLKLVSNGFELTDVGGVELEEGPLLDKDVSYLSGGLPVINPVPEVLQQLGVEVGQLGNVGEQLVKDVFWNDGRPGLSLLGHQEVPEVHRDHLEYVHVVALRAQ